MNRQKRISQNITLEAIENFLKNGWEIIDLRVSNVKLCKNWSSGNMTKKRKTNKKQATVKKQKTLKKQTTVKKKINKKSEEIETEYFDGVDSQGKKRYNTDSFIDNVQGKQVSIITSNQEENKNVHVRSIGGGVFKVERVEADQDVDETMIMISDSPGIFSENRDDLIEDLPKTVKQTVDSVNDDYSTSYQVTKFNAATLFENQRYQVSKDKKSVVVNSAGKVLVKVPRQEAWDLDLSVASNIPTEDLRGEKKVIIVEKKDIANAIRETDFVKSNGYRVISLGGNPFSAIERNSKSKVNPVRTTKNTATWRKDQAFASFKYPILDDDAQVIMISDNDYLGRYLGYQVSKVLNTENVNRINDESTSSEYWDKVLSSGEYNQNLPIGETWFVSSQSEVGANMTSYFQNNGGIIDRYTESFRNGTKFKDFKKGYLQGFRSNFSEVQLGIMGKILDESLGQKMNIELLLKTESGIEKINTSIKADNLSKITNVYFDAENRQKMNIMNTDQTVMFLMRDLKINSSQVEDIIKRMSTQGLISYPRTDKQGISQSEKLSNEELLNVWSKYSNVNIDRDQAIEKMNELRIDSGKSGLMVISSTKLPKDSVEYKVLESIAKYNLMAVTGGEFLKGKYVLEYELNDGESKDAETDEVTIINSPDFGRAVGEVIDVSVNQKTGISDMELYSWLGERSIGTVSTRSSLISRMEKEGMILKYHGEYRLDDRARVLINTLRIIEDKNNFVESRKLTNGIPWMKKQIGDIRDEEGFYSSKNELYSLLDLYIHEIKTMDMQQVQDVMNYQNNLLSPELRVANIQKDVIEVLDHESNQESKV